MANTIPSNAGVYAFKEDEKIVYVGAGNLRWGEPNISKEVDELLENCEWFYIYDIIERFYQVIQPKSDLRKKLMFFFKAKGIGWKLNNGRIEFRGDESFETDLKKAGEVLTVAQLHTARNEIREAISDLSRRPNLDITGAIRHGVACLECVTRDVAGNTSMTLGEHPNSFNKLFGQKPKSRRLNSGNRSINNRS